MQLLGLDRAGGVHADVIARRTRELVNAQHSHGGWAQTPYLESDAYATGQALYALATLPIERQRLDASRRSLPARHATCGRFVACGEPCDEVLTILRERFPIWRRSMDFASRHGVGGHGAGARTDGRRWVTLSGALNAT